MARSNTGRLLHIFATDVDLQSVETAREGVYPHSIDADVSEQRLERFFTKHASGYQIGLEIRDSILFAQHDIFKDLLFLRLDLLACQNFFGQLPVHTQVQMLQLFHVALKPNGLLLLGPCTLTGVLDERFSPVHAEVGLYRRRQNGRDAQPRASLSSRTPDVVSRAPATSTVLNPYMQAVVDCFTPACVFVDSNADIIYVHGRTGPYLELPTGQPSRNILTMARKGLRAQLAIALRRAAEQQKPVSLEGVEVATNGRSTFIDLHVRPLDKPELQGLFLIGFVPARASSALIAELERVRRERHTLREHNKELQESRQRALSHNRKAHRANTKLKARLSALSLDEDSDIEKP